MKRLFSTISVAVAILTAWLAGAPQTVSQTRARVETLASETFEGRLAGSNGERLAGEYIASQLQAIGARPMPDRSDFFFPFEFTAGTRDGGSHIELRGSTSKPTDGAAGPIEWGFVAAPIAAGASPGGVVRALSFSDSGDVEGTLVFAGYGIVVPDSQNFVYDSYAGLDVKDKIVLVLRYFPEDADQKTKAILARYSDLRYKAMAARQRGARAMLVVTGPHSPNAGELAPMTFDTALAGSGIVAVSISGEVAGQIFRGVPDKKI